MISFETYRLVVALAVIAGAFGLLCLFIALLSWRRKAAFSKMVDLLAADNVMLGEKNRDLHARLHAQSVDDGIVLQFVELSERARRLETETIELRAQKADLIEACDEALANASCWRDEHNVVIERMTELQADYDAIKAENDELLGKVVFVDESETTAPVPSSNTN